MVQDRATVTMADQQSVVYYLSIGAIFSDLERPTFQGHANIRRWIISVTVQDRHMDSFKTLHKPYYRCNFRMVLNVLEWLKKILVHKTNGIVPTPSDFGTVD